MCAVEEVSRTLLVTKNERGRDHSERSELKQCRWRCYGGIFVIRFIILGCGFCRRRPLSSSGRGHACVTPFRQAATPAFVVAPLRHRLHLYVQRRSLLGLMRRYLAPDYTARISVVSKTRVTILSKRRSRQCLYILSLSANGAWGFRFHQQRKN